MLDLAWLAAAIDFEGSLCLFKDKYGWARRGFSWVSKLSIGNINKDILDHCLSITGLGSVSGGYSYKKNHRPFFVWAVSANGLRELLPRVIPYLIIKRKHAELICEALDIIKTHWGNQYHLGENGDQRLEEIYCEMKQLNKRGA